MKPLYFFFCMFLIMSCSKSTDENPITETMSYQTKNQTIQFNVVSDEYYLIANSYLLSSTHSTEEIFSMIKTFESLEGVVFAEPNFTKLLKQNLQNICFLVTESIPLRCSLLGGQVSGIRCQELELYLKPSEFLREFRNPQ